MVAERGDHGVAGAADVVHLALLGLDVQHAALAGTASCPPRRASAAAPPGRAAGAASARAAPGRASLFQVPTISAQLGAVRRHQVRALVARVVVALGVDQHPLAGRARARRSCARCARGRPCRSPTGSPRCRPAARPRNRPAWRPAPRATGGVSKSMRSSWCWRPPMTRSFCVVRMDLSRWKLDLDAARVPEHVRRALAPSASSPITDSERAASAPSAAQLRATLAAPPGLLLRAEQHHRHRRLGRDARDVAEPVAVEHHVADHQHARLPRVRAPSQLSFRSGNTRSRARAPWPDRTGSGRRISPAS